MEKLLLAPIRGVAPIEVLSILCNHLPHRRDSIGFTADRADYVVTIEVVPQLSTIPDDDALGFVIYHPLPHRLCRT